MTELLNRECKLKKTENRSTVCSGAGILRAVKIKVPLPTHWPNRKTYQSMMIISKCQISADIVALGASTTTALLIREHVMFHTLFISSEEDSVHSEVPAD